MLANGWPREQGERLIFTLFTSLQVSGILTGKKETEAAGSQYLVSSSDYEKKVWWGEGSWMEKLLENRGPLPFNKAKESFTLAHLFPEIGP